ncbi:hypothetical protein RKD37_002674 [Streptomyces ambofaciens]
MPSMEHIKTTARLAIAPDSEVVNYVSSQLRDAYAPLSAAWVQLDRRLTGIAGTRREIARQYRPAPERGREVLAASDQANLPNLGRDLAQVRSAETAYVVKWYEKSQP